MILVSYGAASFTKKSITLGSRAAIIKQSVPAHSVIIPAEHHESLVPRKLNRMRTHFSKKYRWN